MTTKPCSRRPLAAELLSRILARAWRESPWGAVCKLLDVAEHTLINPVRAGKIKLTCVGGRRLWMQRDVLAAAAILGKDSPAIHAVVTAGTSLDLK